MMNSVYQIGAQNSTWLEGGLFGPADDLFLELGPQIDEVIAVAGDQDDEVAEFFRMLLCLPQGLGRHHIELDVMAVELEVRPDEMGQLADPLLSGQELGREFLVEKSAPCPQLVHLGHRLDHRRTALPVSPLDW